MNKEIKIVDINEIKVIGYKIDTTSSESKSFKEIPVFWDNLLKEKKFEKIPNVISDRSFGICYNYNEENNTFSYIAGLEVNNFNNMQDNMEKIILPKGKYAVISCDIKEIKSSWEHIVNWVQNHKKYKHVNGAEFELYDDRFDKEKVLDIYIPVKDK